AQFDQLPASTRRSFDLDNVGKLMHATPLYYVLAAGVYRLSAETSLLTRAHIQRIFAVLVSSPIVLLAYLITRELFSAENSDHAAMRLTIPTLVAFHPMLTEIGAVISVDGLFFVFYSLAIYLGLLIYRHGYTRRYAIALGLVFGLGVLLKPTMNGFAPLVILLLLYDFWQRPAQRKQLVGNALISAVLVMLPVGWWMQRSLRLNNDLFYFNPVLKGHRIITNPLYDYGFLQHAVDFQQSIWGGMFVTWWAHFGWIDTPLPAWVYNGLRILTFTAILGLCLRLLRHLRHAEPAQRWTALFPWLYLALIIIFPALLMQYYDLSFWHTYGVGRGLQGRYWLGTAIPMLLLFTVGLKLLLPHRWSPYLHTALRVGMVLLNFVSLLGYIVPRYYL
ncbi:MAG TPA: hypothetical protein ENJ56_04225, partial [Anaerolineae bacterium]|nr:hypothetical protein [Anaerolineae bacterium]